MNSNQPTPLPTFVSQQVSEARRFFLNLAPSIESSLEVVCGGAERVRTDYCVERNDFPYYAIEFVAEGKGLLTINGQEWPLSAGSAFAYGPGAHHSIRNRCDPGMRKYYLDFFGAHSTALLKEAGLLNDKGCYAAIAISGVYELTDVFEMLIRDACHGGPMSEPICATLTRLILQKIRQLRLPEGTEMPRAYATYDRIKCHVDSHFLRLHTAKDIADDCRVTPVYLSRLFRRFSDCGAYDYLLRLKMNYAAALLANNGIMVKDVAEQLAFSDPFQFSRCFKRVYGISPSQLRAVQQ